MGIANELRCINTMLAGADGILLDIKGKFTMWKPNASCLSSNLVVILLFLSRVKSRLRYEATEVDSVVSEIFYYTWNIPDLFD